MTNNNIKGNGQVAQAGLAYLNEETVQASFIIMACQQLQTEEWSCNGKTLVIGSGRDQHIVTADHCTCSRFEHGYECWHLTAFRLACELAQITA